MAVCSSWLNKTNPPEEVEEHLNPSLSPEQIKAQRTAEIETRLQELDLQSVRPLRAKVDGSATAEDDTKLSAIELECQALRAELSAL